MDMMTKLTTAAERLFDRHGYMSTGMDQLIGAAGVSSRTLYKHAGSKDRLMARVLTERGRRFMARIDVASVDALFSALKDWNRTEGTRGCLFLRALAETGGDRPEISEATFAHKAAFRQRIGEIVAAELGHDEPVLADQVLVLFEGATQAAVYRGEEAISSARAAARILMEKMRA